MKAATEPVAFSVTVKAAQSHSYWCAVGATAAAEQLKVTATDTVAAKVAATDTVAIKVTAAGTGANKDTEQQSQLHATVKF